ncbi:MAG TPA: hypothetical protein VF149_00430 [Bacillales bacterium]
MIRKILFSLFAVGILLGSSHLASDQSTQNLETAKANTIHYTAEDDAIPS